MIKRITSKYMDTEYKETKEFKIKKDIWVALRREKQLQEELERLKLNPPLIRIFKKREVYLYKKKVKKSRVLRKRKLNWSRTKIIVRRLRKKWFAWKKKKKHKRLRHQHNFFFFFTRRRKRYPRFTRKSIGKGTYWGRSLTEMLHNAKTAPKYMRIRFKQRLKNRVLKKRSLEKKLRRYYVLSIYEFKKLNKKIRKVKKYKISHLLFFLEFKLPSVCLRFHFFWTLRRAYDWTSRGVVAANNTIVHAKYNVKVNDFIKVSGFRRLWQKRVVKMWGLRKYHIRFNLSINYSELMYEIRSGIILKIPSKFKEIKTIILWRRKRWLKVRTLSYLVNNFY